MLSRLALFLLLCSVGAVSAETYVVTNTIDSGPGSLRQAITDANAHPNSGEVDRINFMIPGAGVRTIIVASVLPEISEPLLIDGWTQPSWNGAPLIELSAQAGAAINGLVITGGGTTIRGLVMNGFQAAIRVNQTGNNTVKGCYLGTDKTGQLPAPNDWGIHGLSPSSHNLIGGTTAADRNIISGNRFYGIYFTEQDRFAPRGQGNTIQGNYIGTDVTGTIALPNGTTQSPGAFPGGGILIFSNGVRIGGSEPGAGNLISGNAGNGLILEGFSAVIEGNLVGTNVSGSAALPNNGIGLSVASLGGRTGGTAAGARNIVSGNTNNGISIASTSGTIQGNFVGTDVTGKIALPNGGRGITIAGTENLIGGREAGAGNLISGNVGGGIGFFSGSSFIRIPPQEIPASSNVVEANLIGTDVTGTTALPNGSDGIYFARGGFAGGSNRIGGTLSGAGNIISGNQGNGIYIENKGGTVIQGNLIGTASDGTKSLGNGQTGILLVDCTFSTVGSASGPNPTLANTIAFNLGDGVVLTGASQQQRVSSNSIHDNGQLGIDLGDDGPTPNDSGDADSGPNGLQNFPVISSAFAFNGKLTIYGSLHSVASTNFRLEFVANPAADSSGFGEGRVLLGQARVTTDSSGNALFNVTFPLPPGVASVSATTLISEFSAAVSIAPTAPTAPPTGPTAVILPNTPELLNLSSRLRVETGQGVLIGGFIVSGTEPKKIAVRAIGPSLAAFNVPGRLEDPVLELFDSSGQLLAANDNWKENQQAEIENSGLAPASDLESAIVRTVPAGNYTAIVRGKNDTTGVGLVEVYDLDKVADAALANISSRGFVGNGDNVLISGFIAEDPVGDNVTVAIRGLGPSLASFGITNFLADPTIELRNVNGTLLNSNNEWIHSEHYDKIKESGLEPRDSHEAMILYGVTPGNYTAILRGTSSGTGVGLLEIYNLR
jgi:hypothetical protein